MSRSRLAVLLTALCCAAGAAQAASSPSIDVETRKLQRLLGSPRQAAELLRLYRHVVRQPPVFESAAEPPDDRGDPLALALALPELERQLRELAPRLDSVARPPVLAAADDFAQARRALQAGGASPRFLVGVLLAMAQGQQQLELALTASPPSRALLLPAVQSTREAARRQSTRLIELALRAGVSPAVAAAAQAAVTRGDAAHAAGAYALAVVHYGQGLGFASGALQFSVDRFEQNLRSVFDTQTIGYAYAIGRGGQFARSGFNGLARTGADAPATLQSPTRKMHVASVSKTLTAIVTLNLLAARGLTPDEPIGPWLPSAWPRGAGVDALTFKQVMRHRSGFEQNAVAGSSFPHLQAVVAKPVGSTGYEYNNANFGLMRVLVAGLMGIDASQFGEFDGGALTASAFLLQAQQLYGAIGVDFSCEPSAGKPTVIYHFPADGLSGYAHQPKALACGGFGVFVSAEELARVLAFLRHSEQLLVPQARQWMTEHYLGLKDPAKSSWAAGALGEYLGHGGDWSKTHNSGSGRLDSCVVMFPGDIEAAVVVNSGASDSASYAPGGYQCGVLAWAYENAWVAP